MTSVIYYKDIKYMEHNYNVEKDYEEIIQKNTRLLFGSSTIYIDLKTRIETISSPCISLMPNWIYLLSLTLR